MLPYWSETSNRQVSPTILGEYVSLSVQAFSKSYILNIVSIRIIIRIRITLFYMEFKTMNTS